MMTVDKCVGGSLKALTLTTAALMMQKKGFSCPLCRNSLLVATRSGADAADAARG